MKKVLTAFLVVVMAVVSVSVLSACNKKQPETTEIVTGPVYKVSKDKEGNEYAVLEKYSISDEDAKKIADGDYEDLMLDLEINFYNETIPVKEISAGAFANQLALRSIVIGANVETIGSGCFAGCSNLKELTVPFVGGVKENAKNAQKTLAYLFGSAEASGTTSVTVKYNESSSSTFYIPDSLKKVTLTGDVVTDYAFYGLPVEEVVLTGSVKAIGVSSFAAMTNLNTVAIPESVEEIKKSAFSGCTNLYKVDFSKATGLKTIWQEAFTGCSNLNFDGSTLTLPDSVEKIYYSAFRDCTSLKKVDLSNTAIQAVPDTCFYGCTALKEIAVKDGVSFGQYAYPDETAVTKK
ncbi:MAG: leucine-rich repeat domain-containing protein [Christensenellaceae bacterium]